MAERYYGQAVGGATDPSKMACRRPDGSLVDVFVKYSWAQCAPGALAREIISALLAKELAVPVAEPVLVSVDATLLDGLSCGRPEIASRLRDSVVPMYGSVYLGEGYSLCGRDLPGDSGVLQSALDVWAFDQLILNPDRSELKPNCLLKGTSLIAIDHEKALHVDGAGFLFHVPWDSRWRPSVSHLFRAVPEWSGANLTRLHAAWCQLDFCRIKEIFDAIPAAWDVQDLLEDIFKYLLDLQRNLDAAFGNLKGVRP